MLEHGPLKPARIRGFLTSLACLVIVVSLVGCGGGDDDQPGETMTVEAGEVVEASNGVKVRAQSTSIEESLTITVVEEEAPLDDVPLKGNIEARGQAFRISGDRQVYTDNDAPFLVGLPIPEGVDPENLAVAELTPPDTYWYDVPPDAEVKDFEPPTIWMFNRAYVVEDRVAFTTSGLHPDGTLYTVVEGGSFQSLTPDDQTVRSHTDEAFIGVCKGDFSSTPDTCDSDDERQAQRALANTFHNIQDFGFNEPSLNKVANIGGLDFGSDAEMTAYEIGLRPCSNHGSTVGLYKFASNKAWACVGSNGFNSGTQDTVRHEFFHATQHGYQQGRAEAGIADLFIVEGQAVTSEHSELSLSRAPRRPLRPVDAALYDDSGNLEYQSQDFWLFLGDFLGETDLSFLEPFLEAGPIELDLQRVLDETYDTTLRTAYFEWVKNQTFESQYTASNSALNAECVFNPAAVNNTLKVNYTRSGGLDQQQITLGALEAEVVEFTLQPASEPYLVSVIVSQPGKVSPDWGRMYQRYTSATDACLDPVNPWFTFVAVQPGQPETVYGVLANGDRNTSETRTYTFRVEDQDANVSLDITKPADGSTHTEGTLIEFDTDIQASEGIDKVVWRTDGPPYDGDAFTRGETASAGLLCPGNHNITATLTDERGLTDSDQITITVENDEPSVEFETSPLPTEVGSGNYLVLEAEAIDDTCVGGPGTDNADDALIEWIVDGNFNNSGELIQYKLDQKDPGDVIEVEARYTDEDGATAAAGPIQLDVTSPPPGGYPPRVTIVHPDGGDLESTALQAEGRAVDAEDGPLTGSDLQWEVVGEGQTISIGTGEDPPDYHWIGDFNRGDFITLRLTVTDSDGNTVTDSVDLDLIGGG